MRYSVLIALFINLLGPSTALAQYAPPQGDPYTLPSYEAHTAPVFVEPGAIDTWIDEPGLATYNTFVPELSPAAQDLGNLIPPGSRPGFFQKLNFGALWMPQFEGDGLGMTEVNTNVVTALPFFHRHQPLTITPSYTARFLEGPDFIDVPSRLHDVELKFNHLRRLSDHWVLNAAVTLGAYADDHSFDASDAFRVSGYAAGLYEVSPTTRWIIGVAYLNRADATIVPVVGFMYTTDDLKIDLVLPQPRIAWRVWSDGPPGYNERWLFVQGEYGGGIWAVERVGGAADNLSYTDYRLSVGTDRKLIGGISRRWELGYVFGRELEYDSVGSDIEIDDSVFVRAGFTW